MWIRMTKYTLLLIMSLTFFTSYGITRKGDFFSSGDDKIYAYNSEGEKVTVWFGIGYKDNAPFMGQLNITRSINTEKFPSWFPQLKDHTSLMWIKFKGVEKPMTVGCAMSPESAKVSGLGISKFSIQIVFIISKDKALMDNLLTKDIEFIGIKPPSTTSYSADDIYVLDFNGLTPNPKTSFNKIIAKAKSELNSTSKATYGKIEFNGYTWEWDDYAGRSHDIQNGTLGIETKASHSVAVQYNSLVSYLSPAYKDKEKVRWTTRKGAINISLPNSVKINNDDEIICWEQNGSSDDPNYRTVTMFIWSPSTSQLQCVRTTRRTWGRTLNDIYYFRTFDSSAWSKIKPKLLQELPYCGTQVY